jgi:hypothetical protein
MKGSGILKVYPNPSSGTVTLEIPGTFSSGRFSIRNLCGKELITRQVNVARPVINVADLPAGVYFVSVTTNDCILTAKIVKQ